MTEEVQAVQGPSMQLEQGALVFNRKRLKGVYQCKIHRSKLMFNKGAVTISNVTWKASPKYGFWIACCRECKQVLKDARNKRFVCPIEEPQPEE